MEKKVLFLITEGYPLGDEYFLEDEMRIIASHFVKIVIITKKRNQSEAKLFFPENAVFFRYNQNLSLFDKIKALKFLFSKLFYEEVYLATKKYNLDLSLKLLKNIYMDLVRASKLKSFIKIKIRNENIAESKIYLYSYWHDCSALSLALIKKSNSQYKCISRAHGWDVFAERHQFPYLPFKKFIISKLDSTYSISVTGKKELDEKYGFIKTRKVKVSRLGKINDRLPNYYISKSNYIICSCSELLPVKRIHLIIDVISKLNSEDIEWIHFGEGYLRQELEEYAKSKIPSNIKYAFRGIVPNNEILDFYNTNSVDLFLNLSKSEGIPVSIMEALSAGIPVLATDVGGTKEAVNNNHGFIIDKDFNIDETAEKIKTYLNSSDEMKLKYKNNAYKYWQSHYQARKNYMDFYNDIIEL